METFQRRTDGVTDRTIDEETIVVDVERSTYLSLNASGVVLWRALEHEQSLDSLIAVLAAEYDVDPGSVRGDVEAFLAMCREAQLLVVPTGS